MFTCRYVCVIAGSCRFGDRCRHSHDTGGQGKTGLQMAGIGEEELLTLLSCSAPRLCLNYNRSSGCPDFACPDLHLCRQQVFQRCSKGTKKAAAFFNNIRASARIVLKYPIPMAIKSWVLQSLREVYFSSEKVIGNQSEKVQQYFRACSWMPASSSGCLKAFVFVEDIQEIHADGAIEGGFSSEDCS